MPWIILELDKEGSQKARNIYGTNLLLRETGGKTYYYLYNGHADVTALFTADGTVAATYYYDAFGNIIEKTGDVNNNIRYAGYQYDEETGLYYVNARMYDPVTARFLQEDTYTGDPNDPLSLNLYTYCSNNPIKYWDPTGHWAKDVHYQKTYKIAYNKFYKYIDKKTDLSKKKVKELATKYAKAMASVYENGGGISYFPGNEG